MGCEICDGLGWLPSVHERGVGWVDVRCPKCNYSHRALPPIPAPVDALILLSDKKRIQLGEEHEWAQHGPAW